MEQIAIISGKGSSGKTTLAENKVITDCDVDAPDLYQHLCRHLPLKPEVRETHEFIRQRLSRVPGVPVIKSATGRFGAIKKIGGCVNEDHNSL